MRIDVKKYLFAGIDEEKKPFFEEAQKLGVIHFIDTVPGSTKESPQEISDFIQAMKILRGIEPVKQEESDAYALAPGYVNKILTLKHKMEHLHEELRVLKLEEVRIRPFGNFNWEDIHQLEKESNIKFQFFCGKAGIHLDIPEYPDLIYIGTEDNLDYFVSLAKESASYDKLIEMKIDKPLQQIKEEEKSRAKDLHDSEQALKKYAKYSDFLHHAFVKLLNKYHLEENIEFTRDAMPGLFVVEGWVPDNKVQEVESLSNKWSVHIEEIAIEPEDQIPTYIENEGWGTMGQDLIGIYDTPSKTDLDPSYWVLFAFAIFFAFIVGDGGYGAVYLGFFVYLRYRYPNLKGLKKRILNLCTFLAVFCIGWGLITNSFFGMTFDLNSPARKFSVITWLAEKKADYIIHKEAFGYHDWLKKYPDLKGVVNGHEFLDKGVSTNELGKPAYEILSSFSDNILLELALFLGVIHVLVGMIRYLNRNWVNLGWIIFLIGAYLYFPYYLQVPSFLNYVFHVSYKRGAEIGLQLIYAGIGIALLISLFKHKWLGIFEVMGLIQVFADVLSYLRLYALGLAGSIVAATINEAAASVPFIVAVVLLILAHVVNMALGIMSGVIHGLRLNFLEWYHYSFEGGGKKFKPLQMIKIE